MDKIFIILHVDGMREVRSSVLDLIGVKAQIWTGIPGY